MAKFSSILLAKHWTNNLYIGSLCRKAKPVFSQYLPIPIPIPIYGCKQINAFVDRNDFGLMFWLHLVYFDQFRLDQKMLMNEQFRCSVTFSIDGAVTAASNGGDQLFTLTSPLRLALNIFFRNPGLVVLGRDFWSRDCGYRFICICRDHRAEIVANSQVLKYQECGFQNLTLLSFVSPITYRDPDWNFRRFKS